MHHLRKSRHGAYIFRQAVPQALRCCVGKTELLISLNTKDPVQARIRGYILSVEVLALFQELKHMPKQPGEPDIGAILENLKQNQGKKYEAEFHPSGALKKLKTDSAEDHARAMELAKLQKQPARFPPLNDEQSRLMKGLRHFSIESKSLDEAFAAYDEDHIKIRKTKSWPKHLRPMFVDFIAWIKQKHPRITIDKIDGQDLREYRTQLLARKNDSATVQKKINSLDSFFRFCQDGSRKWLPDGDNSRPTSGMAGKAKSDPWQKFSDDDITQMFEPQAYLDHNQRLPHQYWLPLLALYGGGRLNECCRLRPADFIVVDDVHAVDYEYAATKNKNSKRTVPLHQGLIDLGLLDYVRLVKEMRGANSHLFPYLVRPDKAGGDGFAGFADKVGITDERKVFHSFRHTIAFKMKHVGFKETYQEYYTGHLSYKLHYQVYADQDKPMRLFYKDLCKVHMPIDVAGLKLPAEHWPEILQHELHKHARRTTSQARQKRKAAHEKGAQKKQQS